jgi:HlyD family secretion protein
MKKSQRLIFIAIGILTSCTSGNGNSDAYGNFESDEIIISSQANGEIIILDIEEGMTVKTDQILGLIDTTDLHLSRLEILANIELISSQYKNLSAQINVLLSEKRNIEREIERTKKLLISDAATQKQLDDLEGNIEVVKAKIATVESQNPTVVGQIKVLRAKLNQIDEKINKSIIVSPIDGVILNKIAMAHQLAAPGAMLFIMADLSNLIFRAYVSGNQITDIKLNSEVTVLVDDMESEMRKYPGIVSWISSESEFTPKIIQTKEERVDMVYAIKIVVPNDGSLKIGMPGEVLFSVNAEN